MSGIRPANGGIAESYRQGLQDGGGGIAAQWRLENQARLNVNGVDITQDDYERAMEHGVLPQGAEFTQWMKWAFQNPLDATAQLAKGVAGFVVETGKDMIAVAEWGEVQVFGAGERTTAELEELNHRALRGAAFLGSMVAFGGLGRVAFAARPLFANLGRGLASGAVYGAIRPPEEGETDRAEMMMKDALVFGAFGLASDVVGLGFRRLRGKPLTSRGIPVGETERSVMLRRSPEYRTLTYTWENAAREAGKVQLPKSGRLEPDAYLRWRGLVKSSHLTEEAIEQAKHLPLSPDDLKHIKPLLADGSVAKVGTAPLAGGAAKKATTPVDASFVTRADIRSLPLDKLKSRVEHAIEADANMLERFFGKEGAARYKALERKANSPLGGQRADEAYEALVKMEESLTPAQQKQLYGLDYPQGVGGARELRSLLREVNDAIDVADSATAELENTFIRELTTGNVLKNDESFLRARAAFQELRNRGLGEDDFARMIRERAARSGENADDLVELFQRGLAEIKETRPPAAAPGPARLAEAVPSSEALSVEPAGMMYVAEQGGKKGFGFTPQEALDQLGIVSYKTQAAVIRDGLQFLDGVNNLIARQKMGEIVEVGGVRPLGPLYKGLMPVHTWERVWPGWRQVWEGARNRRLVQEQHWARWKLLIDRTKGELSEKERIALGDLLNKYATADQLPKGTSQKMARWFGEWRTSLDMDRAELAKLFGKTPDEWGLDAYFMHVWAGDWMVTDAAGNIIRFGEGASGEAGIYATAQQAREAASRYLDMNPSGNVQVRPNRMMWDVERAGAVAMEPGQYVAYLRKAPDILGVSSIGEIKMGGQKFFGNALNREAQLPGWLRDPTQAAQIYARGYSRKVAYHDFAEVVHRQVNKAFDLGQIDGTFRDAAKDWANRVVGRPTMNEQRWNKVIDWLGARPGVPEIVSRGLGELRLRRLTANIRKVEGWSKLGYSPLSAFVNMTQTYVNTASKIGYRDTMAGINLFSRATALGKKGNAQLAASIDNLLQEMGVEFAVPLSALGDASFKSTHELAWWSPLYLFNKVETANRGIASLAGYAQELKAAGYNIDDLVTRGEGFVWRRVPQEIHERAIAAGKRLSDQVNFVYSVEDLPGLISGPVGQVLGQFKPFLINELNFISQLQGAERVRFAAHLLTAGGVGAVMSLPIINLVDVAAGEITGERISEYAKRHAPRFARGFLGALGFSAEQSVALNSIMAGRNGILNADEFPKAWQQALGAELGPFAGDALALAVTVADIGMTQLSGRPMTTPEQRRQLLRQWYPTELRRMMDAYKIASTGQVVSPVSERPIFAPDNPKQEALLTFMGFKSVELEEARREQATISRVAQQLTVARQNYLEEIVHALKAGRRDEVRDIVQRARANDIYISSDDVRNAVKRQFPTTTEQAIQGLPRELKKRYGDLYGSNVLPPFVRRR